MHPAISYLKLSLCARLRTAEAFACFPLFLRCELIYFAIYHPLLFLTFLIHLSSQEDIVLCNSPRCNQSLPARHCLLKVKAGTLLFS